MGKIIIATKIYIRSSGILKANPSNSTEKTLKSPMNSGPWPTVRLFPRRIIIFKPLCIMSVPTAKLSSLSSHLPIKNTGKCPKGDFSLMVEHSAWWTSCAESSWAGSTQRKPGQLEMGVHRAHCACQLTSAPPSALGKSQKVRNATGLQNWKQNFKEAKQEIHLFLGMQLYPAQLLVQNSCADSVGQWTNSEGEGQQMLSQTGYQLLELSFTSLTLHHSHFILINNYWVEMVPLPPHLENSSVSWLFN